MDTKYDYINSTYGLAVQRGTRVKYTGGKVSVLGSVTGVHSASLKIKIDGDNSSACYHPTWEIEYLTTETTETTQQ